MARITTVFAVCAWGLAVLGGPFMAPVHGVTLTGLTQNADTVGRYEKFEATFTLDTEFDNPFDANAVALDAIMTCPDQSQRVVPAFTFRQYEVVGSGPEDYRNPGPGLWKIRFAPSRTGAYRYSLRLTVRDTIVTSLGSGGAFTCVESGRRGPVRRDPNDDHCLCYDDGSPRTNVGHNVCWTDRGLAGFQAYFQKMHAAGENWSRLWMCAFSNCSILEWRPNKSGYFQGLGQYSLQIAQRLDGVIEAAEQAGIAIQLVLQHHGQFSTTVNPNWSDNPYNVTRGGMLTSPEGFFSHAEARRLTRNKYRYIVARWGYSSAILAWELWNEVQFTDGWAKTRQDVVAWHREMSEVLRRIDPQSHLITTSSDTGAAFSPIWDLPCIDLVQHHQYGSPEIESYRDNLGLLASRFAKPVLMGEFGIGQDNPENSPQSLAEPLQTQVRTGLALHNGIWASFFAKSSGHLWWWDTYIDPLDLYRVFAPLQRYADQETLAGLQEAPRVVSGSPSLHARPLILDFWGVSELTEFWFDGTGFPGMDRLASYLHGTSKSAYRSNPKFHVTMPMAGALVIHLGSVSSWGNNRLRVWVNGEAVSTQSLVNGSSNVEIQVVLAAGDQTVQIENLGQDWAQVSDYEFRPRVISALGSLGWMGPDRAVLWIYDVDHQYGRTGHGRISGETLRVPHLADGPYEVTTWDTLGQEGVLSRGEVLVTGQTLVWSLPDFTGDIAVKIRRSAAADAR